MPGMSVPSEPFGDIIDPERAEQAEDQLNPTGGDNEAHAAGKICKRCGQVIQAYQDARLTGVDDWVHETCPVATG
ncbi:MAG: hypothetical protein ACRDPY_47225 [Streptosporangiaceae bacterium]